MEKTMFNGYFKLPEGTLSAAVDILREDFTSNLLVVSIDPNSQSFQLEVFSSHILSICWFWVAPKKVVCTYCTYSMYNLRPNASYLIILIASWHFEPPGQFSHWHGSLGGPFNPWIQTHPWKLIRNSNDVGWRTYLLRNMYTSCFSWHYKSVFKKLKDRITPHV